MSERELRAINRTIMLTSATSSNVNITANIQKVVCTDDAGTSLMPAPTGSRSWIVHGWRPTSATIHPAWLHTHTKGSDTIPA